MLSSLAWKSGLGVYIELSEFFKALMGKTVKAWSSSCYT